MCARRRDGVGYVDVDGDGDGGFVSWGVRRRGSGLMLCQAPLLPCSTHAPFLLFFFFFFFFLLFF